MESNMLIQKCTPYDVALGMGFNVNNVASKENLNTTGLTQFVKYEYVNNNEIPVTGIATSQSSFQVIKQASDATMLAGGSLQIGLDMAEIIKLSGKAELQFESSDHCTKASAVFTSSVTTRCVRLNLDELEAHKDLLVNIDKTATTHVVSSVTYGRSFKGCMKLTDNSKGSSIKAQGELEAKLGNIPISGKGDLKFEQMKNDTDLTFEAEVTTIGMTEKGAFYPSMESFFQAAQNFIEAGNKDDVIQGVVAYELTPIEGLKSLEGAREPIPGHVKLVAKKSKHILDYAESSRYVLCLLEKDPSTAQRRSLLALQDKILEMEMNFSDPPTDKQECHDLCKMAGKCKVQGDCLFQLVPEQDSDLLREFVKELKDKQQVVRPEVQPTPARTCQLESGGTYKIKSANGLYLATDSNPETHLVCLKPEGDDWRISLVDTSDRANKYYIRKVGGGYLSVDGCFPDAFIQDELDGELDGAGHWILELNNDALQLKGCSKAARSSVLEGVNNYTCGVSHPPGVWYLSSGPRASARFVHEDSEPHSGDMETKFCVWTFEKSCG